MPARPDRSPYLALAAASPVLSREEELALALEYQKTKSPEARDRLTRSMLRYIVSVAARYQSGGLSLSDLVADGVVGVLHALDKFEPERGHRFVTFASYWVRAEIVSSIFRHRSLVRSGAPRAKLLFKLRRESARIASEQGESAEAMEALAERMGVSRMQLDGLLARMQRRDVSLDSPAGGEEGGADLVQSLPEPGPSPEDDLSARQTSKGVPEAVRDALDSLDDRERLIAERRLLAAPEEELTLAEIGRALSVSRERARQLEVRAKAKLRAHIQGALTLDHPAMAQYAA
jgi:RNA polymerase sigma-32 factor